MQSEKEVYDMDDLRALLVTAFRCYDLLAVIARALNEEEAEKVINGHENAELFMSPPAYREVIDGTD